MAPKRQKIHFESVEELLGAPITKDITEEIQIDQIRPFKDHPFKVIDDSRMEDLVKSIAVNGVLTPVMLRPCAEGGYEMISGHRRMHAAKLAGLKTVPAVIKEMDYDAAVVAMVDSNVQREEILPSERAFAFKMKMDALNRQGARTDLTSGLEVQKLDEEDAIYEDEVTSGTEVQKLDEKWSRDKIGKDAGMGGRQVQRYLRLTELIPELLDFVDAKKIGISMAVDISYFDKELQSWIAEYIDETGFLRPVQIEALKNTDNVENITHTVMKQIMRDALPENKPSRKVSLSEKKLDKYFPPHFSAKEREMVILGLLEKWQQENQQ